MNPAVQDYFHKRCSSLFMWGDHGRELTWCDGTTITFHAELSGLIDRLATDGLPEFDYVVVGLAAMRQSWPQITQRLSLTLGEFQTSDDQNVIQMISLHQGGIRQWTESARRMELLTSFASTPGITTQDGTRLLAEILSNLRSARPPQEISAIAAALRAGLPEECLRSNDPLAILLLPFSVAALRQLRTSRLMRSSVLPTFLSLIEAVNAVADCIFGNSVEELQQWLKTGIAELPNSDVEPVSLPNQSAAVRRLLDEISDDNELQGFARLAGQLIAASMLPRTLTEAEEIPAGGVSDITNRGQPDRLLLSELAHDDLTLAVRIALNEALYLRRESPPAPQPTQRPVLIDTSLPMWGLPRLYATAMATAMHVQSDPNLRIQCYRARGAELESADLTSREGVIEQLAVLESSQHPGLALPRFVELAGGQEANFADPVVITTTDVLDCEDFRRRLDSALQTPGAPASLWLICAERDGRLQVFQRTKQGISLRKQIQLPLEEILSRRAAQTLHRGEFAGDLPAIFGIRSFPLLMSHQVRPGRIWTWHESVVAASDDGRLMLWTKRYLGARQLADNLPRINTGEVHLVQRDSTRFVLMILRPDGSCLLCSVDRFTLALTQVAADLRLSSVSDIVALDGVVMAFQVQDQTITNCRAVDLNGRFLGELTLGAEAQHRVGRCMRIDGKWSVLCPTGGRAAWTIQVLPAEYQGYLQVVEYSPGEYLALEQDHVLVNPANSDFKETVGRQLQEFRIEMILRTIPGERKVIIRAESIRSQSAWRAHMWVNAVSGALGSLRALQHSLVDYELNQSETIVRARTPHYRFEMIGTVHSSGILLRDANGLVFRISLLEQQKSIVLQKLTSEYGSADFVTFDEPGIIQGVGYTLRAAKFPNGSRAWLDGRGLLHLKSSNNALCEITLVLRDGALSGWLSTGFIFGELYHCGSEDSPDSLPQMSAAEVWKSALVPFIEAIPWTFLSKFDTAQDGSTMLPEY